MSASVPSNAVQSNGIGAVSDGQLNTFVQGDQTAAQLRGFVGISGMTVMLHGITAPGDGGGGMFYWANGNYTDNNSTTIVPPGAAGQGAWLLAGLVISFGGNLTLSGTLTVNGAATFSGGIANAGTVSAGTWSGSLISPTYGGTGVNNGTKVITLGGNLTTSGAFGLVFGLSGATNVTLPTSGTLMANALPSAEILVGNGANVATAVAVSGDATITNAGAVTVGSLNGETVSLGGSLTTGGAVTFSGAHTFTGTLTGATAVTFPTSGTLAALGTAQNFTAAQTLSAAGTALSVTNNATIGGTLTLGAAMDFATSTTGSGTQTFTNSPAGTLTTAQWIPVSIIGQTGTWYIPAVK